MVATLAWNCKFLSLLACEFIPTQPFAGPLLCTRAKEPNRGIGNCVRPFAHPLLRTQPIPNFKSNSIPWFPLGILKSLFTTLGANSFRSEFARIACEATAGEFALCKGTRACFAPSTTCVKIHSCEGLRGNEFARKQAPARVNFYGNQFHYWNQVPCFGGHTEQGKVLRLGGLFRLPLGIPFLAELGAKQPVRGICNFANLVLGAKQARVPLHSAKEA